MRSDRPSSPPLHLAALAVAAGLAFWVSGSLALSPRPPHRDGVGDFDRALVPLRDALGPRARIGLLLPTEDVAPWYLVQYALAPATVVRLRAGDCAPGGPATDCPGDATHLLVGSPTVEGAAAFGSPLGFVPVARSAGLVLLARSAR